VVSYAESWFGKAILGTLIVQRQSFDQKGQDDGVFILRAILNWKFRIVAEA
jgi:hypothetical protein